MEEFIRELGEDFCSDNYIINDGEVILKISSTKFVIRCPFCGESSRKVYSIYEREIQDLPLQNKRLYYWLRQGIFIFESCM